MKIFDKSILEDENNINNFCTEINEFITLNMEMQEEYKNTLFEHISKIVDIPVTYAENDNSKSLVDFLNELKSNLLIVKENIIKLEKLKSNTLADISANSKLEDIENLFIEFTNLQKFLLKEDIAINKFISYSTKFVSSILGSSENSSSQISSNNSNNIAETTELNNIKNNIDSVILKFDNNDNLLENTLVISEMQNKVILPYNIQDLDESIKSSDKKYSSYAEVIDEVYTVPYNIYRNSTFARFREAFKLVKDKEKKSIKEAFDLGIELYLNYNLHPAIISACKNIDELDIYLSYLETNETDKFNCFNIKFEVPPSVVKKKSK